VILAEEQSVAHKISKIFTGGGGGGRYKVSLRVEIGECDTCL